VFGVGRSVLRDLLGNGVTGFDLANNYDPRCGSAEENLVKPHRFLSARNVVQFSNTVESLNNLDFTEKIH